MYRTDYPDPYNGDQIAFMKLVKALPRVLSLFSLESISRSGNLVGHQKGTSRLTPDLRRPRCGARIIVYFVANDLRS